MVTGGLLHDRKKAGEESAQLNKEASQYTQYDRYSVKGMYKGRDLIFLGICRKSILCMAIFVFSVPRSLKVNTINLQSKK